MKKTISNLHISAAKEIRKELKEELPLWEFSLRTKTHRRNFITLYDQIKDEVIPSMTLIIKKSPIIFSTHIIGNGKHGVLLSKNRFGLNITGFFLNNHKSINDKLENIPPELPEDIDKIVQILQGQLKSGKINTGVSIYNISIIEAHDIQVTNMLQEKMMIL